MFNHFDHSISGVEGRAQDSQSFLDETNDNKKPVNSHRQMNQNLPGRDLETDHSGDEVPVNKIRCVSRILGVHRHAAFVQHQVNDLCIGLILVYESITYIAIRLIFGLEYDHRSVGCRVVMLY